MKLTEFTIRSLPIPAQGQVTTWDDLTGFGVRCSQGGSKTFIVMKGSRRYSLGRYPHLQLREAREKARQLLARLALGEQYNPTVSFQELFDLFFSVQCTPQRNKPRTIRDYKRLLSRHFVPPFSSKPIKDITPTHISIILEALLDTPSEATHAFVAIRTIMNFAVKRQFISNNPTGSLEPPAKAAQQDRVLTDDELGKIVWTARSHPSQFSDLLLTLLYTGQRRSEIAALRWSYINGDLCTLPPELTKNNREHVFVLPGTLQQLFVRLPRTSVYVFPNGKGQPFSNFSNAKADFDKLCPINGWTLHHLRKTLSTNLASLSVPIDVTEAILNHLTGSRTPIQRVYDRHSRIPQMREAIVKWETRLLAIGGEQA